MSGHVRLLGLGADRYPASRRMYQRQREALDCAREAAADAARWGHPIAEAAVGAYLDHMATLEGDSA